jgi:hypothetical protein
MPPRFQLPDEMALELDTEPIETSDRALKNFRYVVAAVDEQAQRVWADIWEQLKGGVTPAGMVLPEVGQKGFQPSCGWPEFLEKFWLLKHYLDYMHRFAKGD